MAEKDPLYKGLEEAGQRIIDKMVDTLFEQRAVVTGNLARNLTYEVKEKNGNYSLIIIDNSGKGGYDYGNSVDQGLERGPGGMPPVKAIVDWIKRRGISTPSSFKTPEQFAYVIARSIASKGQRFKEPKPFIAPSVEFVARQYLPEVLENSGVKFINEELDKIK